MKENQIFQIQAVCHERKQNRTIIAKMVCGTGWHRWNQKEEYFLTRGIPFKLDDTKINRLSLKEGAGLRILSIN